MDKDGREQAKDREKDGRESGQTIGRKMEESGQKIERDRGSSRLTHTPLLSC